MRKFSIHLNKNNIEFDSNFTINIDLIKVKNCNVNWANFEW